MADTNYFARIGQDITDAELINDYGLDPTKNIDKQMFDIMEQKNVEYYMTSENMSKDKAKTTARKQRREKEKTQREVLELLDKK